MQSILVIEDDRAIRGAIVDILELEGYDVLSAEDGVVGVALARQHRPTLIISDIMMPHLDGYGVLTELRKHISTATIPFIFLTARTTQEDIRQGMNLGADDYLTKPFRAEALVRTIQARIERQTRLAEKLQERMDDLHKSLTRVLPHELNTPLQGIVAGVEFLREEFSTLQPADVEELLWIVHQSALRMRRLVGNSLLYADLELMRSQGKRSLPPSNLESIAVASPIESIARQEAATVDREADLKLQLQDANIEILCAHFNKLVEEVLNNAFTYSKAGTPVEVVSRCEGDSLCLSITDYGRGMSSDEVKAISAFRQFQRQSYEQQGLGLGLTICQGILDLYQGEMVLESVVGEHTSVQITLPLATSVRSPRAGQINHEKLAR